MSVPREQAKTHLQRQIDAIADLKTRKYDNPDFQPWRQQTLRIVKRIFGEQSDHQQQFSSIFEVGVVRAGLPDSSYQVPYENGLAEAESTLKSFIEELDLFDTSPSMDCPKCKSQDVMYLEIDEVGGHKYSLAIPKIAGAEWKTGKKAAFFKCGKCQTVFYTEAQKRAP